MSTGDGDVLCSGRVWETSPMDVEGGAFVVVEGVQREYKLRDTFLGPKFLCVAALFVGVVIGLLIYLLRTYLPLIFIWVPFVLIGVASATVTRVERTARTFMISSGLNDAWQLAIADVVRAGVVKNECRLSKARTFRLETSARDNCYGTKNYEFDLEDVNTFVQENFRPYAAPPVVVVAQPVVTRTVNGTGQSRSARVFVA